MNADRLFYLYDRMTDAPDAVGRLRRFVLDLAVRGKLVEQDPADEPASELLKRIAAEKARLLKAREIRKPRAVAPLDENGIPFSLPTAWEWAQIAQLGVVSPRNEAPEDHQASFVPMKLIAAGYGAGHQHETRRWADIRKGYTHFAEGDVGLAKITPCFENGKSTVFRNLTGGIGSGTTELHVVRPLFVTADYIVLFLKSSHFIETGILRMTGTAGQKRVPTEYFTSSPFPLPPLAEQHRIVAKVDELFALCDRLEEARTAREDTRDRLTKASLIRLVAPDIDAPTFRSHARFAVDALPALTARADQVKNLRRTILNLAVRGKLVEQDPADEPASELLKRIAEEKAKLVVAGKFRTFNVSLLADHVTYHFPIPANWTWCRLDDLAVVARGGSPRPIKSYLTDDSDGIPWIKIGDSVRGSIYINHTKERIRSEGLTKSRLVSPGDLLLSNSMSFGYPYITRIEGCIHDGWLVIRTPEALVDKLYLHTLFRSGHAKQVFSESASGAVVQNLNTAKVRKLPVPLPPLAEQQRIVVKVDELMALCDRMATGLAAADSTRTRLLESLLHDALASAAYEATTPTRPEARNTWPERARSGGVPSRS